MGRNGKKRYRPYRYLKSPNNEKKKMSTFIFQNNKDNEVQLLISQLHKNERLNDPKLTSKEKELLDMKVRLNDGTLGYVFTISKHHYSWKYACHVCKVPNMSQLELYLHIVAPRHVNRLKMTVHLKHKFLLKEVNSCFVNVESEEIEEDENQTVCQIQSSVDSFMKPLIGLEYLLELVDGKNNKIEYFCLLCSRLDTRTTLFDHLINSNHYIKFMTMFFPSVTQKLKAVKNKGVFSNYVKLVTHVAASLEHVYGRLKPKQVESKAFSHTSKLSLLEKIDRGRHFRETPGNTFEDCVNLSHLEPGACPVLVGNRGEGIWLQEKKFVKKEPLAVEERNENADNYYPLSDRGFAGHSDSSHFASQQSQGGRGEHNWANNRSYDDAKRFDLKPDRDSIHRPPFQPAPERDNQFTSKQRISNSNDYLSHEDPGKRAMSTHEETYSSSTTENCDVIPVLRQLSLLENHLGSLGPKVRDLVLEVSHMAMSSKNVTHQIVSSQEHYVFLETVKHKLMGFLEFGVMEPRLGDIAQNAIENITLLLSYGSVKSEHVDEKTLNSERQPHDGVWTRENVLNSERHPYDREWSREKTLNSERNPYDREWSRENTFNSERNPHDGKWSRERTLNSERNPHDREWSREKTLNSERNPHDSKQSREKTFNSERYSHDKNYEGHPHDGKWSRERIMSSERYPHDKEWSKEKTLNSERHLHDGERSTQVNRSGLTISEIPNFIEKQYLVAHLSFVEKEKLSSQVCSYLNNLNKFEVSEDDLFKMLNIILKSLPREEYHDYNLGSSQQWSRSSPRGESHDYNLQTSRSSQQWPRREFYSDRDRILFIQNRISYGSPTRERNVDNIAITDNRENSIASAGQDYNMYVHRMKGNDPYGFQYKRNDIR